MGVSGLIRLQRWQWCCLLALAIAAVHIKDFFPPQQGFSLSIPDAGAGRWLKLASGVVTLAAGAIMLLRPEWL